jgi:hypothetical protein
VLPKILIALILAVLFVVFRALLRRGPRVTRPMELQPGLAHARRSGLAGGCSNGVKFRS